MLFTRSRLIGRVLTRLYLICWVEIKSIFYSPLQGEVGVAKTVKKFPLFTFNFPLSEKPIIAGTLSQKIYPPHKKIYLPPPTKKRNSFFNTEFQWLLCFSLFKCVPRVFSCVYSKFILASQICLRDF